MSGKDGIAPEYDCTYKTTMSLWWLEVFSKRIFAVFTKLQILILRNTQRNLVGFDDFIAIAQFFV